jgi:phospholipase C
MANERKPPAGRNSVPAIPDEILKSGLSRRGMLKALGLMGSAAAVAGTGSAAWAATAGPGPAASGRYVLPHGFKGTMADLKHVVILMQENRSLDHY